MEITGNSQEAFTSRILLLSALLYLFTAMETYILKLYLWRCHIFTASYEFDTMCKLSGDQVFLIVFSYC